MGSEEQVDETAETMPQKRNDDVDLEERQTTEAIKNVEDVLRTLAEASADQVSQFFADSLMIRAVTDSTDEDVLTISLASKLQFWKELLISLLKSKRGNLFNGVLEYIQNEDVKLQALEAAKTVLNEASTKNETLTIENLFALLAKLTAPVNSTKLRKTFYPIDKANGLKAMIKFKTLRRLYSQIWLKFIKLKLPSTVHCESLVLIPENVMQHVQDPILLTDFFFKSYSLGDPFNILALNGIFTLIVKHNLDYPDFYTQIYGLLKPSMFYLQNREQFFHLLDLFLSSTHVPSYLVAAFIKRLARLTLIAPPDCILILLTLIKNWLTRHANLSCLINRTSEETNVIDTYLMDEADPQNSNAIESSLWEVKSLQSHYLPEVSKRASFIDRPIEHIEDPFVQKSMDKLLVRNLKKAAKEEAPLNFTIPDGLFMSSDFNACFVW